MLLLDMGYTLRVISLYRTVLVEASLVVTALVPFELLADIIDNNNFFHEYIFDMAWNDNHISSNTGFCRNV